MDLNNVMIGITQQTRRKRCREREKFHIDHSRVLICEFIRDERKREISKAFKSQGPESTLTYLSQQWQHALVAALLDRLLHLVGRFHGVVGLGFGCPRHPEVVIIVVVAAAAATIVVVGPGRNLS
jgi:hypothetical protein